MWAPTVLGLDDKTYLETANESCVIIAQIESRRGVEKCAEIAAVDGVGMVFFLFFLDFCFFSLGNGG